jgi:hypothetical protein
MEPESLLPHSPVPTTGLYPEPAQSSRYSTSHFLPFQAWRLLYENFNIPKFYILLTLCLYIRMYVLQNKLRILPYTVFSDRFSYLCQVFTARYELDL